MGPCDCEVGSAKGIALRVRYKLGKFYDETFGVIADDEWRRIKIFGLLWRIYWSSAMKAMTRHYILYPTGIGQTKPICEKGGIAISSLSTTSSPFSLKNPLICTNIQLSKLALHGTPSSGGKKKILVRKTKEAYLWSGALPFSQFDVKLSILWHNYFHCKSNFHYNQRQSVNHD